MEDKTSSPEVDTKKENNQSHEGVKPHAGRVVAFTTYSQSRFHLTYTVVAFIVIIVAVASTLVYEHYHNNQVVSKVCSDNTSMLNRSYTDLKRNDLTSLSIVTTNITSQSSYSKDPSCLYILTAWSLAELNSSQATKYMNQLSSLNTGDVSSILLNYKSVVELKSSVAALQKSSLDTLSGGGGAIQPGAKK